LEVVRGEKLWHVMENVIYTRNFHLLCDRLTGDMVAHSSYSLSVGLS